MSFIAKTNLPEVFPAQQAYLAVECAPTDTAEKRRLVQVRRHVLAHAYT